jgi:stearoyl-CoA desaturase (delta-9 desaturase)
VNWITAIAMTAIHVLGFSALFFIDWAAIAVAAALLFVSLSWGIGMGYHRLHTHRGYKVPKPLEYFLAICGTLALEGGPIFWVAVHRIHHQRSDQPGDPHSPHDGGWWAHVLWMIFGDGLHNKTDVLGKYAPDLYRDPFYRLLNTWHWVPLTLSGFILLAIGGWTWVLWGVFARVTLGLHFTWLVNSATHMWGSRRFHTRDESRNLWWVALLTFGEGWHNNHHAYPTSARHGLAWFELDVTWLQIRLLEKLGIARAVHVADTEGSVELRQAA